MALFVGGRVDASRDFGFVGGRVGGMAVSCDLGAREENNHVSCRSTSSYMKHKLCQTLTKTTILGEQIWVQIWPNF